MIAKIISTIKTMLVGKVVELPVVEVFSAIIPVTLPLATSGALQKPLFRLELTVEATTEQELLEQTFNIYSRYLDIGPKPTELLSHDSDGHSWSSKFTYVP